MINCFKLHDDYTCCFELIENVESLLDEIANWGKKDIGYFAPVYWRRDSYVVINTHTALRLKSERDVVLMRKLPYLYVSREHRFVFFELLEQEELKRILTREDIVFLGEQKNMGVSYYLLADKRFLVADIYGRSGELYSIKEDFDALSF